MNTFLPFMMYIPRLRLSTDSSLRPSIAYAPVFCLSFSILFTAVCGYYAIKAFRMHEKVLALTQHPEGRSINWAGWVFASYCALVCLYGLLCLFFYSYLPQIIYLLSNIAIYCTQSYLIERISRTISVSVNKNWLGNGW